MAAVTETAGSTASNDSPRCEGKPNHRTPWAQVVRGPVDMPELPSENQESDSLESREVSDIGDAGNVGRKEAWSKPGSGVYSSVASGDHGGAMEDAAWPALGDSTRFPQKSVSPSVPAVTVPEISVSPSQVSVTSSSHQPTQDDVNHNTSTNNPPISRQRSMRRGGDVPHNNIPSSVFGSQSIPSNEPFNRRSSSRGGNFGQHRRPEGRNNYHGGRRDYNQGSHDWNSSQPVHVKGSHGRPRSFGPPMQGHAPFGPPMMRPQGNFVPPNMRPYGDITNNPDLFPYYYVYPFTPEVFGGFPYYGTPSSFVDPMLRNQLMGQIHYYFSDENLARDGYLKSHMDNEGWVSISLIAGFRRVQSLNISTPCIIDILRSSTFLEIQGDKVRRREDWVKWVLSQNLSGSPENLTTSLQKMSLEGNLDNTPVSVC